MPTINDVVIWETLRAVKLTRGEHAHANIDDDIRRAFDRNGDKCQAVPRSDGCGRVTQVVGIVAAVVAHQEGRYAHGAGLDLWRELVLDQGVMLGTRSDSRHQFVHGSADAVPTKRRQVRSDDLLLAARSGDRRQRLLRVVPRSHVVSAVVLGDVCDGQGEVSALHAAADGA